MAARIAHSSHFILNFFSHTPFNPLRDALPSVYSLCSFCITAILAALSEVSVNLFVCFVCLGSKGKVRDLSFFSPQEYLCCDYGWSYRFLHIVVGLILLSIVGTVVGLSEPKLVGFILDRLPVDNPVTKLLLARTAAIRSTARGAAKQKKKKKN